MRARSRLSVRVPPSAYSSRRARSRHAHPAPRFFGALLRSPGAAVPLLAALVAALPCATPARAASLPAGFTDQPVVSGLSAPSSLAFLPDGRVLVTEQVSGRVRLVVNGAIGPVDPILTIPDVDPSGGEQGLVGLAVDPAWPARPYVYFYFNRTPGNTNYLVMYRASGDLDDPASGDIVLDSRYDILTDVPDAAPVHNGGTVRFGPDGMLYLSVGDDADRCAAQDPSSWKGAVLRLNVSKLPDRGPGPPPKRRLRTTGDRFSRSDPNGSLVYCHGLRNPFRFHIDPWTGLLYIGDVGENGFEEVNECGGGENFGWPFREGPATRVPAGCAEPGGPGASDYDDPIVWYDRTGFTAAVVTAGVYHPVPGGAFSFPAEYDGDLFYADFFRGFVRRLEWNGAAWAPADSAPGQPTAADWATGVANAADWTTGPDGALYYVRRFPDELRRIVHVGAAAPSPAALAAAPVGAPSPSAVRGAPPAARTLAARAGEGGAVSIAFDLAESSPVALEIFDVLGRRVARVASGSRGPGSFTETWDGRDAAGARAPSGIYFAKLTTRAGRLVVRIAYLRR